MKFQLRRIRNMGLIGFSILLALNAIGYFGLGQTAAIMFSDSWWSTWAPSYLAWSVFLIVGAGACKKEQKY